PASGLDLVRSGYKVGDATWRKYLSQGIVPGTASRPVRVALDSAAIDALPVGKQGAGLEVAFRPDPTLWDGRFANNAWLQELPKPVTTLVWDNAAVIGPALAKKLGVVPEVGESDAVNIAQYTGRRMVEVVVDGKKVSLPAWILPGQPEDTITLTLGGGRTHGGEVAVGRGFDTYAVRTTTGLSRVDGVSATVTGEEYRLVFTQPHHQLKAEYAESTNRDIVRVATLAEYRAKDGAIFEEAHHGLNRANGSAEHATHDGHGAAAPGLGESRPADPSGVWQYTEDSAANKEGWPSLYPEYSNRNYNQWAMSIDLTTCIGCNACTIACQAENNIPVVGKEQVARGREMHWIRMDHYYEGDDLANPVSHFMPVPCMQCEKAPCEPVCPVAATIHSHEGLNQMVYNRCIGTRYCSNNCPYKVRRFNFLKWTEGSKVGSGLLDYYNKPQLKMLANPDVSVRGRGVMEKCTYCVQRINHVRIEAKKEGREIQDGEIITACQQACPTKAIVFGDINNPASEVSLLKAQPHDYGLLADLNTRPRTTYLAKVRNTHPDLETA
ncbi:MAG: 4Fe-4S dicluster domain-containing protein, partial [Armatimonadota bacterium]